MKKRINIKALFLTAILGITSLILLLPFGGIKTMAAEPVTGVLPVTDKIGIWISKYDSFGEVQRPVYSISLTTNHSTYNGQTRFHKLDAVQTIEYGGFTSRGIYGVRRLRFDLTDLFNGADVCGVLQDYSFNYSVQSVTLHSAFKKVYADKHIYEIDSVNVINSNLFKWKALAWTENLVTINYNILIQPPEDVAVISYISSLTEQWETITTTVSDFRANYNAPKYASYVRNINNEIMISFDIKGDIYYGTPQYRFEKATVNIYDTYKSNIKKWYDFSKKDELIKQVKVTYYDELPKIETPDYNNNLGFVSKKYTLGTLTTAERTQINDTKGYTLAHIGGLKPLMGKVSIYTVNRYMLPVGSSGYLKYSGGGEYNLLNQIMTVAVIGVAIFAVFVFVKSRKGR